MVHRSRFVRNGKLRLGHSVSIHATVGKGCSESKSKISHNSKAKSAATAKLKVETSSHLLALRRRFGLARGCEQQKTHIASLKKPRQCGFALWSGQMPELKPSNV